MPGLGESGKRASFSGLQHLPLEPVPPENERLWQEVAASNRERIIMLERELERARDALHEMRSEVQAARYLGEKVGQLAGDIRDLTTRLEAVARHAVAKPSSSALAVFGQYVGLLVAIIALVVATTR